MDTRDMILETAFVSFLENGFKGVSLNEILRKTTMTKGAFYYYFDSKEVLISEVIKKYFFNFISSNIDELLSIEGSTIDKIPQAIEAISSIEQRVKEISPSIRNIRDYLMLLQQALQINETLREGYLLSINKAKQSLIVILEQGQCNNDIRNDIDALDMVEMVNITVKGAMFESSMLTNESVAHVLKRNMQTLLNLFKAK